MAKGKLKIGVLMGGPSSEYEVSLKTGEKVIENLNKNIYEAIPVNISKNGGWYFKGLKSSPEDVFKKIDLAFIAMHGEYGEDGKVQVILEQHDVPYTGSGKFSSQVAIDKAHSKRIFSSNGLLTPKSAVIKYGEKSFLVKFENVSKNGPWVVKPASRGSSVGASVVKNREDIFDAVHKALMYDDHVLVEEFISGREFTCGVLENHNNKKYFALPITEIIPNSNHIFFDYNAKYEKGASKEITPAEIAPDLTKLIQSAAVSAHAMLGCSGYSRSDFILSPQNEIFILELNTLPGMTETSLLPQAANAAGIRFPELLDRIIQNAFDKYHNTA